MTVGTTQIERPGAQISVKNSRTRRWIAAAGIAVAAMGGTGIFLAVSGSEGSVGTPAVSSPEVPYTDPGVDARQDALKRFHGDARPETSGSSYQDALKRFHEDAKG